MKNQLLPFLTFCVFIFFACGSNTEQPIKKEEQQEVQKLDSLSTEIEKVTTELETKTKELETAIDDLLEE